MSARQIRASYPDTRSWIRAIPGASATAPATGLPMPGATGAAALPADPVAQFLDWLEEAVVAGVVEPHVATLSTVDEAGAPDARTLLLKDVTEAGWWFSSDRRSPKARQLDADPVAALTFYWREQGRQVRVRGSVVRGDADVSARDFLERSVTARAVAAASRQSEILTDVAEYDAAVRESVAEVEADPSYVEDTWQAWCLVPETVEFWHADPGRRHLRVRYRRSLEVEGVSWARDALWP
ncbi:pyridoxal 5'-phosphate synthase [Rhodococcus sp. TAF43]|uniref:pyridoxine/pyridoxamine 5'-phosphate oxidase n=1 Tax=unclassified Rhodococcus (in: high G+C Gram-positive bacteria) TaxID=192944 RepID=UPI0015828277|nr:pyridoxal 5'-phosphate synthase [Rhodococcus sp. W8901]QKT10577.1 pyridoxal 5'-phosphate synthase [Rhodococcus sp. W8901]